MSSHCLTLVAFLPLLAVTSTVRATPRPDQIARFSAILTPDQVGRLGLDAGANVEGIDLVVSDEEVRASGRLPDVPLDVLTAGRPKPAPSGFPATELDRVWRELQAELAPLTPQGVQVVVEGDGHAIMLQRPEAVVEAIRGVVEGEEGDRPNSPRSLG